MTEQPAQPEQPVWKAFWTERLLCQPATVRRDPESVAEAVRRYAERYPQPAPNPQRVAIEIRVRRVTGSVKVPLPAAD
jgi:hypothetical protein